MNRQTSSFRQSMRAFLCALEATGDLVTISQSVSPDFEIAGCLAETDGGPALHFSHVKGAAAARAMPIVGNLLNSPSRFAAGLGIATSALQSALIAAIEKPLPHRIVLSAPCQEDIIP